jgi:hypothetical protein
MAIITAKIDVTKIDKNRLFKGQKGTYLDIVLIETPNDKNGNHYMVVESITKEERDSGKQGTILGNAKIIGGGTSARQMTAPSTPPNEADLPY